MTKTVFALYKNLTNAYNAVEDLRRSGFEPVNVSLFGKDSLVSEVHTQRGTNFGALIGGLTGLVLVWGFADIPGSGSIFAMGPVVTAIGGVIGFGIGAGVGVLIGYLVTALVQTLLAFAPPAVYPREIRPGNALVTLSSSPERIDGAAAILVRYHPLDVRYSNGDVPEPAPIKNVIRL